MVPPTKQSAHPFHRATKSRAELARASVRAIAAREGVSPSLVSLHLKLLRLAAQIQIFLRELTASKALRYFSFRRLVGLAGLDLQEQQRAFDAFRRQFVSGCRLDRSCVPNLGLH
jgi:hypothetical protein